MRSVADCAGKTLAQRGKGWSWIAALLGCWLLAVETGESRTQRSGGDREPDRIVRESASRTVNFVFVKVAEWPSSHSWAIETSELDRVGNVYAVRARGDSCACGSLPLCDDLSRVLSGSCMTALVSGTRSVK